MTVLGFMVGSFVLILCALGAVVRNRVGGSFEEDRAVNGGGVFNCN